MRIQTANNEVVQLKMFGSLEGRKIKAVILSKEDLERMIWCADGTIKGMLHNLANGFVKESEE